MYSWMEGLGATIPKEIKRPNPYIIWWNERSPLLNQSGYVVACKQGIPYFTSQANSKKPGEGVNPYIEPEFIERASFSGGGYDFGIFQFDFKSKRT